MFNLNILAVQGTQEGYFSLHTGTGSALHYIRFIILKDNVKTLTKKIVKEYLKSDKFLNQAFEEKGIHLDDYQDFNLKVISFIPKNY